MSGEPDAGIDRTLEEWAEAFAAGDIDALVGLVTEDAEFWPPGQPALVGRAAARAAFRSFYDRFEATQRFEELERWVTPPTALLRGIEHNRVMPRDGGDEIVQRQRAFSFLRLEADGRWRFARGITTPPPPAG